MKTRGVLETEDNWPAVLGQQYSSMLRALIPHRDAVDDRLLSELEGVQQANTLVTILSHFAHKMPASTEALDLAMLVLEIRNQSGFWVDSDADFELARELLNRQPREEWLVSLLALCEAHRAEDQGQLTKAVDGYTLLTSLNGYVSHIAFVCIGLLALEEGDEQKALQMLANASQVTQDHIMALRGYDDRLYRALMAKNIQDPMMLQYAKLLSTNPFK